MSNYLAIATVSAALSRLLQGEVGLDVPGAKVTTLRPDSAEGATPEPRVNLYAYQVTPNAAMRNTDLQTRRADGSLIQRPQIALDIHYLVSFYGDESKLEPQRLLGIAARTLHARPILTRKMIQDTIRQPEFDFLQTSDLADAIELVRLTPLGLNLEELSKLWSVFFQVRYALSIAYQASVVLIESEETPRTALPVRDRNIYVIPIRYPIIEQIRTEAGNHQPIVHNSNLILQGRQLRPQSDQTLIVRVGTTEVSPADITDTEVRVSLATIPPDRLQSGLLGVQLIYPLRIGTPPVPHRGIESNVVGIVLRPTIEVDPPEILSNTTSNSITYYDGQLTVHFVPSVKPTQRIILLLNEFQTDPTSSSARGYNFKAPKNNGIPIPPDQDVSLSDATTDQITFDFQGVAAGSYLVRIQVDGAESLLTVRPDPQNPDRPDPNDPRYISPQITLP